MRDVLAVASVIVVALCLGVAAAYLSVDLTPPGLELIRPPKADVAEQIEREEKQRNIYASASECKYCVAVAELAQTFAKHAKSARQHATALETAMVLDKNAERRDGELLAADRSADSAEAAAAALTSWASRCKSDDICKARPARSVGAACQKEPDARAEVISTLAASIQQATRACATATCPSVDCQSTAALSGDLRYLQSTLDLVGGRDSALSAGTNAATLPVGASNLKAELKRVSDEAVYVTKMLPLLIDSSKKKVANGQLNKLISEMLDERAVSSSQLAIVMAKASAVSDLKVDPRNEASWRLKSLAANLAMLGQVTSTFENGKMQWGSAADSLGAALFDLAKLQAMLARVSSAANIPAGCDKSAALAMQRLRESAAMLDLCRMRSACAARGARDLGAVSAKADFQTIADRAQRTAEGLIVNEIGSSSVIPASADETISSIDVLRSEQGVCRRAAELRQASGAAPAVTQAVVDAVTPGLQPATVPIAPQELVQDAVNASMNSTTNSNEPETLNASSSAPIVQPTEAVPAVAPHSQNSFTGSLFSDGLQGPQADPVQPAASPAP